jgi:hypothetical protein
MAVATFEEERASYTIFKKTIELEIERRIVGYSVGL